MPLSVGIYLFDNVEVLDFAGPYEVFTTASRVASKLNPLLSDVPFEVLTIGRTKDAIRARAGLQLFPDFTFETHPFIDVLLIPGGVITQELEKPEVIEWIITSSKKAKLTASICTGAFLLAKAGLLDGKEATTHWEDIDDLKTMFSSLHVKRSRRWVDEGNIVTSGGISAGIDMSLHLVERLSNRDLALNTAKQMEFDWSENPK